MITISVSSPLSFIASICLYKICLSFVRQGWDPPIIYDTFTDPRGFISRIHGDYPDLEKPPGHPLIKCIKNNTVMYISACDYRIQYKVMLVTDCMGFIDRKKDSISVESQLE